MFNLFNGLMQVASNDLCAKQVTPTPRCNLKVIEEYGDSRLQEREPVSTLGG